MQILLIRHGETDWNIRALLQGREDIPLNREGVRQAEACAAALRGVRADIAATSPLSRARETCEILARAMGCREIYEEPDLIERDFGAASGVPQADIFSKAMEEGEDMEPLEVVGERMERALLRLARGRSGRALAVSHGGAINMLFVRLARNGKGPGVLHLKNTCVNVFETEGGVLRPLAANLTGEEAAGFLRNL